MGSILENGFYNPTRICELGYASPRFIAKLCIQYADETEEVILSNEIRKTSESPIRLNRVY